MTTSPGSSFLATLNPTTKGLLCMLLASMALASMHGIVRHLSQEIHPFVIVFFRNFFGLVAVLPLVIRLGPACLKTEQKTLHIIRVTMGLFAMLSWFYALSKIPITNATALSFSSTIFATLAAWFFLHERIRLRRGLAIAGGILGVLVVLRPGMDGFNVYALLVIASTITWGTNVAIVKKLSQTDSTTSIVAWMCIALTILSIPPALLYWQWPDATQMTWLLLVGILATGGHYAMTSALKLADTAAVMSMDFSRLIWTTIIGAIFFADLLDAWTLVGALIIFASAWYIVFRESKIKQTESSPTKTR